MAANKTIVLVTGANRGIGYEIAAALLQQAPGSKSGSGAPYHVLVCSRSAEKGREAVETLKAEHGSSASALELDVGSRASIEAAAAKVQAEYGRVDVLVNNAGIVSKTPDAIDRLKEVMATNVVGAFTVSEIFKPLLRVQGGQGGSKDKRIINVSSDLGSMGLMTDPTYKYAKLPAHEYRMSKAAMNMMAVCQYTSLAADGIKAFSWTPGFTVTALTGEEDIETRKKGGANDPKDVAKAFVKLVDGSVDEHAPKLIDEHLKVLPW